MISGLRVRDALFHVTQGLPDRHVMIKLATVTPRTMPSPAAALTALRSKIESRLDELLTLSWSDLHTTDSSQPLRYLLCCYLNGVHQHCDHCTAFS